MGTLYIDGKELATVGKLELVSFEDGKVPDYISSVHRPLSADVECSLECEINPQLYSKIMGVDLAQYGDATGFTAEFRVPYQVQIRRHRKKRINKKWAKRYGYKTRFTVARLTDVQLRQYEGEYKFVGRNLYVM